MYERGFIKWQYFQECFEFVKPSLSHAINLLKEKKDEVKQTHRILQNESKSEKMKHESPVSTTGENKAEKMASFYQQHSFDGSHQEIHPGHVSTVWLNGQSSSVIRIAAWPNA